MLKRRYKNKDFIPSLSAFSNYLPDETVNTVYMGLIRKIGSDLTKYGKVILPELGDFVLITYKPRMALNVKTRKIEFLPEKQVVKFRPCRDMKAHFYKVPKKE